MSAVEWGAEIPVNGKRPEWLGDDDIISWFAADCRVWRAVRGIVSAGHLGWDSNVLSIRLLADHPYYGKPTPPQGIAPEVVERALALVKRAATEWLGDSRVSDEARAIVALMEPVDPIEAIAARLIDQQDEPWPAGTESDRLHYWRDKAIKAAKDLRSLAAGDR